MTDNGKIKGVIFDFNGTLFYDSDKHMAAFKNLCVRYGIPVYDDEYILTNIFGKSNRMIMRGYYKPDATDEEVKEFDRIKEDYYRDACLRDRKNLHLARGAVEFLDYLQSRNIPVAIATGSVLCNVEFYFEYLGIGKWFDLSRIAYDDGKVKCKPAPDIYIEAARKLGLKPSECMVFDDATSGLRSATAAGIGSVWAVVLPGNPSPITPDVKVDGIIADFADYEKLFSERFGK